MAKLLDFCRPHVLRSEAEYDAAQERVDGLLRMDLTPDTAEWDELRFLSLLIEDYERQHHPVEAASPQQVVEFMLDQHGMTRGDLADLMGGRSRVSDFFKGKRGLSLRQVKTLSARFGVSADVLIGDEVPGSADG